jgi:hypothetical protein
MLPVLCISYEKENMFCFRRYISVFAHGLLGIELYPMELSQNLSDKLFQRFIESFLSDIKLFYCKTKTRSNIRTGRG